MRIVESSCRETGREGGRNRERGGGGGGRERQRHREREGETETHREVEMEGETERGEHSEHRFPAPSSKEGCRKPVLGV